MLMVLAAAWLAVLPGCDPATSDRDIVWVTPTEAQDLGTPKGFSLSKTKSVAFVDPRTPADFAAGHIPGAVMIPFAEVREGAAEQLRDYDILVVYDSDYDDVVARSMSKRLLEFGHWDVYTLTGGLRAWDKGGFGVEYGMPAESTDPANDAPQAIPKPVYGRPKK